MRGVTELAGAIGLLVPWYTQIIPMLTPIAVICLKLCYRQGSFIIVGMNHETSG
uniref:DoxX family protein n=1 Tax=Spirosoma endophyticum TaxID=662367 RepID=UPI0011601EE0